MTVLKRPEKSKCFDNTEKCGFPWTRTVRFVLEEKVISS